MENDTTENEILKEKKIEAVLRYCGLIDNLGNEINKFLSENNKKKLQNSINYNNNNSNINETIYNNNDNLINYNNNEPKRISNLKINLLYIKFCYEFHDIFSL